MSTYSKIKFIRDTANDRYWQNRVAAELLYLHSLDTMLSLDIDNAINISCDKLISEYNKNEGISSALVFEIENDLSSYSEIAKSYTAHLVAHAHIDMNWMWGYQETSAVVLDTLRTMLLFMEDYPSFTFSQSQASVYQIVERFDKDMLNEIKARIREGRWEVSASTWVEHDKNMPSFESQVRQILYTKDYLSKLLEIDPKDLNLDFEPDTFGHSINVPSILTGAGIKYYYHCRGYEDESVYNWEAPSGDRVLVYREPKWYNADVEPYLLSDMPLMTCKYGLHDMLMVYGVGDHGGGPTRKDLNQLIDMMKWPLYPNMVFSSYKKFFNAIEPYRHELPTVKGELNFVFTGCYTTQSRLKRANKLAECRLYDSEVITSSVYEQLGPLPDQDAYKKAWQNTLFNQFHDILPGSGMNETREFGLALFQDTLAISNNEEQKAFRALIKNIDTSSVLKKSDDNYSESEGGGVGYSVSHVQGYMFSQTERGSGSTRITHIFNTTEFDREEAFDIVLFDYNHPRELIEVRDINNNIVPSTVTESSKYYWKHYVTKVTIIAKVPAFGYTTYVISQKEDDRELSFSENITHRVHNIGEMPVVLENDIVRAEFDKTTMSLNSFIDKRTGTELVTKDSASFELIHESNKRGESSWIVSEFMSIKNINKDFEVKYLSHSNHPYKQNLSYRVEFGDSNIEATVSLRPGSPLIDYDIWVNWVEPGTRATYIPQLRFCLNLPIEPEKYVYDVPMGTVERDPLAHDVPACSYQFAEIDDSGLILISAEKYGFRGYNSKMSLNLLRSSFDPDPYPELGRHQIKFSFGATRDVKEAEILSKKFLHPLISMPGIPGREGALPLSDSFFKTTGCSVSSIKISEDLQGIIVRLYNPGGVKTSSKLSTSKKIKKAYLCDACENTVAEFKGTGTLITVEIPPYSFKNIKIIF